MSLRHIDETRVTRLIVRSFAEDFVADTRLDVAVVGAGPSGITAARLLAAAGYQVAVFERNLYVGGSMWGGGMLFPRIVIQDEAVHIVKEVGVNVQAAGEGYCVVDSVECVSKGTAAALDAGAHIWVGMLVEDVMIDEDARVCGVVLNWGAVERAQMHVDPLAVSARLVIDATGHDADVLRTIERKIAGA
ncbi:MAG: thiazole biosynthesis protein, partial [Armatimonadetes bacterium]|nr:thiazole biosynthesis protein [Armatimonadota bacterium]